VAIVKWARAQNPPCPWSEEVLYGAIRNHDLPLLQWAVSEGCPLDEHVCAIAAEYGCLKGLQWLRQHGCPWTEKTCSNALHKGHIHLLQWARQHGCPWHGRLPPLVWPRRCPDLFSHYVARQWLATHDHYSWHPQIQQWLQHVTQVLHDVLPTVLCPDLVALVQQYT